MILFKMFLSERPTWMYIMQLLVVLTLIAICVTVFMFIRKISVVLCKNCKSEVNEKDMYCPKCGLEMNKNSKEIVIRSKRHKGFIFSFVLSGILVCACIISFIYIYNEGYFSGLNTGFYNEKNELYSQNESIWDLEVENALTPGTLNKIITIENERPSQLFINSMCTSGTLILNIIQDDKVESIDITNTNGLIEFDLSEYSNADIKLSIEHTKAKNINVEIRW